MDVEGLRLFIEAARRGGFAAVARDRDLHPSSVSRAVAALERELGIRLFQRTTRRMALTEAGALYLARVEGLVEELDRARDSARATAGAGPAGTLRLTASVAFGATRLNPLLPDFRREFPALGLELLLTDANLDLVAERVDLAVRLGPGPGVAVAADAVAVKLLGTRYRACASPAYLAGSPPCRRPEDLASHRCLRFALPGLRSAWLFRDASGAVSEVPVDGDVATSSALALRGCALAGMGPALLADWLVDGDIAQGRLVDLFPDRRATATGFDTAAWLVYPSRSLVPAKVRAAVDYLKGRLGASADPRLSRRAAGAASPPAPAGAG